MIVQPSLYEEVKLDGLLADAEPVLKWAGGKRQLLPQLSKRYPKALELGKVDTYIEPFMGGGAVFFDVVRRFPTISRAFIFDINPELVMLYTVLQRDVEGLIKTLGEMEQEYLALDDEGRDADFYKVRETYNESRKHVDVTAYSSSWITRAAQTIFLNRTCFNGLFRVNSKGYFNVPFGRYKNPSILNESRLRASARALQKAEVKLGDFSQAAELCDEKTFIYYDPPYRPISSSASFNAYAADSFDDDSQRRLAQTFKLVDTCGAYQMLSNSDPTNYGEDAFFDDLYKDFIIERVEANRMINSVGSKRDAIREIIVRNYEQ
jgi:DNA adenine methylase